jgi:hypothetical protein
VLFVEIEALTEFSEASTLEDDVEKLLELVLSAERTASKLEEDDDRLSEDVCSVEIDALVVLSAASTLLELDDNDRLDARIVVRVVLVWLRALSIDDELLES